MHLQELELTKNPDAKNSFDSVEKFLWDITNSLKAKGAKFRAGSLDPIENYRVILLKYAAERNGIDKVELLLQNITECLKKKQVIEDEFNPLLFYQIQLKTAAKQRIEAIQTTLSLPEEAAYALIEKYLKDPELWQATLFAVAFTAVGSVIKSEYKDEDGTYTLLFEEGVLSLPLAAFRNFFQNAAPEAPENAAFSEIHFYYWNALETLLTFASTISIFGAKLHADYGYPDHFISSQYNFLYSIQWQKGQTLIFDYDISQEEIGEISILIEDNKQLAVIFNRGYALALNECENHQDFSNADTRSKFTKFLKLSRISRFCVDVKTLEWSLENWKAFFSIFKDDDLRTLKLDWIFAGIDESTKPLLEQFKSEDIPPNLEKLSINGRMVVPQQFLRATIGNLKELKLDCPVDLVSAKIIAEVLISKQKLKELIFSPRWAHGSTEFLLTILLALKKNHSVKTLQLPSFDLTSQPAARAYSDVNTIIQLISDLLQINNQIQCLKIGNMIALVKMIIEIINKNRSLRSLGFEYTENNPAAPSLVELMKSLENNTNLEQLEIMWWGWGITQTWLNAVERLMKSNYLLQIACKAFEPFDWFNEYNNRNRLIQNLLSPIDEYLETRDIDAEEIEKNLADLQSKFPQHISESGEVDDSYLGQAYRLLLGLQYIALGERIEISQQKSIVDCLLYPFRYPKLQQAANIAFANYLRATTLFDAVPEPEAAQFQRCQQMLVRLADYAMDKTQIDIIDNIEWALNVIDHNGNIREFPPHVARPPFMNYKTLEIIAKWALQEEGITDVEKNRLNAFLNRDLQDPCYDFTKLYVCPMFVTLLKDRYPGISQFTVIDSYAWLPRKSLPENTLFNVPEGLVNVDESKVKMEGTKWFTTLFTKLKPQQPFFNPAGKTEAVENTEEQVRKRKTSSSRAPDPHAKRIKVEAEKVESLTKSF